MRKKIIPVLFLIARCFLLILIVIPVMFFYFYLVFSSFVEWLLKPNEKNIKVY